MGVEVKRIATPWASPRDHVAIATRGDLLLRALGESRKHVRDRALAHAIMASGWRQTQQNHNVWKVKRGSWPGDWYVQSTVEHVDGKLVPEVGTRWRSYDSWAQAWSDYPVVHADRYAAAREALFDPDPSATDRFQAALATAGYWTADETMLPPGTLAGVVSAVRRFRAQATEKDRQSAIRWLAGELSPGPSTALGVAGLVFLTILIGGSLCLIALAR